MKIMLFTNWEWVYPTTCVYQIIYDEEDENETQATQYFIMRGLGLCIKFDSYVAHFFIHGRSVIIQQFQSLKRVTNTLFH